MAEIGVATGQDELQSWIESRHRKERRGRRGVSSPGVRFAFYGRTSTVGFQDRDSSRGWQRDAAEEVVSGHGGIVAEFFDGGCSRQLKWEQRPRAAALLAAAAGRERSFDAVVVGEYERAFAGGQFEEVVAKLAGGGVRVWLPEAGGPVDLADPEHAVLMRVLGAQSQREVLRCRHRVLAVMRAQTCEQGRYLGGRPPYGYRLVDAGAHPNKGHAKWGRRPQRLDVDPVRAVHVRWIFAERLAGRSLAGIARRLNERGVPCPSGADRERNAHRPGQAWMVPTVAAILANPRYTGRQVWQRSGARSSDAGAGAPGREEWAVSKEAAHPALVSEGEFVAAQAVRSARPTKDGSVREYVFAGLLACGVCGRRMEAHWANGRAGYRCRHGHSSSRPRGLVRPKGLYVREDRLLEFLPGAFPGCEPLEAVRCLRASDLMIVCDRVNWTVVSAENVESPASDHLAGQAKPGSHPFMGQFCVRGRVEPISYSASARSAFSTARVRLTTELNLAGR